MSTQLFFRVNGATEAIGYFPMGGVNSQTNVSIFAWLSTSRGAAAHTNTLTGIAGPAVNRYTNGYITEPLAADITISGTVTLNQRWFESAMTANCGARVEVYRWSPSSATLSSQLLTTPNFGTEMSTSERAENWTSAITSTDFLAGDRIFVVPCATDAGGTMAGGATFMDEGPTAGASGDSWIQFTEDLTFASAAAGTTMYLTDTASDVSTSDDDRKMDFARGGGVTNITAAPGAGPISSTQYQRSGTNVRWYSPKLQAVTLSGRVKVNLRAKEASANSSGIAVKLIKRDSGGTETDICWGPFCAVAGGPTSGGMDTAESDRNIPMSIPQTVSLADGDRLGVIVYTDDAFAANHGAITDTFYYAGTSGGASGDTYLTFSQTLTEFVASVSFAYPAMTVWNKRRLLL